MRSITQKTKIWWHNVVSRRFGKYSFQILLSLMGRNSNIDFYELTWQKMWHLNVALLYQAFLWFSDLDARVRDLKSSFEYTSLFCKVTLLYAHAALLCIKKKLNWKRYISVFHACNLHIQPKNSELRWVMFCLYLAIKSDTLGMSMFFHSNVSRYN